MEMPKDFDGNVAAAHRYFAATCFNTAWDLMENPARTATDDELMIATSFASLYHWMERPDCNPEKLSIAFWQVSRVHALAGNGAEAIRLGKICLGYSVNLAPFFQAYAHEAIARGAGLCGDAKTLGSHLEAARERLEHVSNPDAHARLAADLQEVAKRFASSRSNDRQRK